MDLQEIQLLVANAKIGEAIELSIDWATKNMDIEIQNNLILLKSRFIRIKQQENMGIVTYTDALREQAIISHSLLELVNNFSSKAKSSQNANPLDQKRRKILFLASNPTDTGKLQLEKEFVRVSKSLQDGNIDFRLVAEWAVTPNDLQKAMLVHKPQIVHFSGHGTNDGNQNGGIILQDSSAMAQTVNGQALANLFSIFSRKFAIDLVLLNSCYSKEQADAISKYVKFVIGMNNSINDNSAIEFSTGFYRGIGTENDVEFAFELAKNMIMLEGLTGSNIPEIYIDGKLQSKN